MKRHIPFAMIQGARQLLGGRNLSCPVCKSKVHAFNRLSDAYFDQWMKHRYAHNIFSIETLNLTAFSCPVCGASDRERLYAIYLSDHLIGKSVKFLDIAPSQQLSDFIRSFRNVIYRSADLHMNDVDDKIDVTDMSLYADGSFDFILCSHVLEHIEEDIKALREIYRVLSPTGQAILMVPIHLELDQDHALTGNMTEEERWHHFGQGDHVRTYSKQGFMEKLRVAGFKTKEITVADYGLSSFRKYGISAKSVLYVVTKQ